MGGMALLEWQLGSRIARAIRRSTNRKGHRVGTELPLRPLVHRSRRGVQMMDVVKLRSIVARETQARALGQLWALPLPLPSLRLAAHQDASSLSTLEAATSTSPRTSNGAAANPAAAGFKAFKVFSTKSYLRYLVPARL